MAYRSIPEQFEGVARTYPERTAFRYKKDGRWIGVDWSESSSRVRHIARSLLALDVAHGDRVAILSGTRLEWSLCDFGIAHTGGVTVGIYQSNLPPDCAYILKDSGAQVVFVENAEQRDKILAERANLPGLRKIILFDGPGDPQQDVLDWESFLALGDKVAEATLVQRAEAVGPDDLATLVYTSGTTGVPKGVMLTHRNLVFVTESLGQMLFIGEDFETLLFLPLAHVYARLIQHCCAKVACTVAFAEDITQVAQNLKEIRPHFIASVPRIYEKVYDAVVSGAESAGGWKRRIFHWALATGYRVSRLQQERRPIPTLLALRHRLAERLVFGKIQDAFGGRLVYAISGGAPLNQAIAEFFHACGVMVLEGIGMTENSSFSNVNTLERNKFGTVGPAGPGIEMAIAEDGEVLFRGDNVMKGYYNKPDATAEALDSEGWLHSGDIGEIDGEGFLKITDRKKDLIITAGGKNVAPQRIERILRTSHYISQAMAYGDRKKFITALVTLALDPVREWARAEGIPVQDAAALAAHPRVHELIGREIEIEQLNGQLASFETVKLFHVLAEDFTVESGELTPTLKLKRRVLIAKHSDLLEALYRDAPARG